MPFSIPIKRLMYMRSIEDVLDIITAKKSTALCLGVARYFRELCTSIRRKSVTFTKFLTEISKSLGQQQVKLFLDNNQEFISQKAKNSKFLSIV